jgi:hypothetical protein
MAESAPSSPSPSPPAFAAANCRPCTGRTSTWHAGASTSPPNPIRLSPRRIGRSAKVEDIGSFGIQFVGGLRGPTDTGDNWNISHVALTAVSGPAGTGTMVSAWGDPLKRFISPNSLWQTSDITLPVPRLPELKVSAESGTDKIGDWTIVTALYPDGTAVKANVDVYSAVAKWVGGANSAKTGASTMEMHLFRKQKIASGPTAQKIYYRCPTDMFCLGVVTGYLPGYASPEITLQKGQVPPQP